MSGSERIKLPLRASFRDIPAFPHFGYQINVGWPYIEMHLEDWAFDGLDLNPDFQRPHVWTWGQRQRYLEYVLRGGEVGRSITFCTISPSRVDWGPITLVDGKQRLESVRMFMRDEIRVFGLTYLEFSGNFRLHRDLLFRVCNLPTRADILQLYLNINAGGTPHTEEELDKVRGMLAACKGESE